MNLPQSTATEIKISVNGDTVLVSPGTTVEQLLASLQIKTRAIAVELNQEILPRNFFSSRTLQADDVLEIVTLVGGG